METIKSNNEISYIFSHGEKYKTRDILFVVLRESEQHGRQGRVAFLAGKKLGNAVWRNRAKRRMRSVVRDLNADLSGCDVLLVARSSINESDYHEMVAKASKVFERLKGDK